MRRSTVLIAATFVAGCCSMSSRDLDPEHAEVLHAERKLHAAPGAVSASALDRIEAGDIIAFRATEASSDGSLMFAAAALSYSHVAIVFPHGEGELRALSANSDDGVLIETLPESVAGREFWVYAYPPGSIDLERLEAFAPQAAFRGTLDYDWSAAVFGLNSNVTPNSFSDIGDEYTCATVVAAALHYSGLTLERASCPYQFISPGDILFSRAWRNLNFGADSRRVTRRDGRSSER